MVLAFVVVARDRECAQKLTHHITGRGPHGQIRLSLGSWTPQVIPGRLSTSLGQAAGQFEGEVSCDKTRSSDFCVRGSGSAEFCRHGSRPGRATARKAANAQRSCSRKLE